MIDIHTHVFNIRYFPLRGILQRWHIPKPLAAGIARIFESLTERDTSLGSHSNILSMSRASIINHIMDDSPSEVLFNPELLSAIDYLAPNEIRALNLDESNLSAFPFSAFSRNKSYGISYFPKPARIKKKILTALLNKAEEYYVRFEIEIKKEISSVRQAKERWKLILKWVYLLMQKETELYEKLAETYPEVSLFVHHMMDMRNYYHNDKAHYEYVSEQLPRMRKLAEKIGGKLIVFAAFDPMRDNGLEIIDHALHNGFCGVKFYPPNGYRPIENTGKWATKLDRNCSRLFEYCVDKDIPLFTHCTPHGFEAKKNSGKNSHPKYWEKILRQPKFHNLRICFGHAGGGEGWFAPNTSSGNQKFTNSYAGKVLELCSNPRYPKTFCGMGYLDEILETQEARHLEQRLKEILASTPSFGKKILYGSDWHMLYKEVGHEDFLDSFEEIFSGTTLSPFKNEFFNSNALDYLNLRGYIRRNQSVLSSQEKQYLNSLG